MLQGTSESDQEEHCCFETSQEGLQNNESVIDTLRGKNVCNPIALIQKGEREQQTCLYTQHEEKSFIL